MRHPPLRHLGSLSAASLAATLATSAAAQNYAQPYPGLEVRTRTLGNNTFSEARVNLCQPGVAVQATGKGVAPRTTEAFAKATMAELAVNGDFYLTSGPVGFAVGAGQAWSADTKTHGFVAFGQNKIDFEGGGLLATLDDPAWSWVREAVGGAPVLVSQGGVVPGNTLGACGDTRARTGVGLSKDRRTLFVAVVNENAGMTCPAFAQHLISLGAHIALNLDGGGSSEMIVRSGTSHSPISQNSTRQQHNHLAIQAEGSGAAPHCPPFSCGATHRVAGSSRFETAAKVAASLRPNAKTAILVNLDGTVMPDALPGGPLSYKLQAPILGVSVDALPGPTKDRLVASGATKVVVLGSTSVVGPKVVSAVEALGIAVQRIGGADRFETAALVASELADAKSVFVVGGANASLVDALAASPVAAFRGAPILYVTADSVPAATKQAIASLGKPEVIVVGGETAVSAAVYAALGATRRIAGSTRYETAAKVAQLGATCGIATKTVWLARSDAMVDAVSVGGYGRLLLLTDPHVLPGATADALEALGAQEGAILGGESAISPMVQEALCGVLPAATQPPPSGACPPAAGGTTSSSSASSGGATSGASSSSGGDGQTGAGGEGGAAQNGAGGEPGSGPLQGGGGFGGEAGSGPAASERTEADGGCRFAPASRPASFAGAVALAAAALAWRRRRPGAGSLEVTDPEGPPR